MDVRPWHSGEISPPSGWYPQREIAELELIQSPTSVQEIYDLFGSADPLKPAEPAKPVALWIGRENCFICNAKLTVKRRDDYMLKFYWSVSNKHRMKKYLRLYFFSKTCQGACDCLDCLSGASIWSGSEVTLRPGYHVGMHHVCPCLFPPELLVKFVAQNQNGMCEFNSMAFAPPQCAALARSGTKTHLIFHRCSFRDEGEAFADAYLAHDNQDSGPAKLDFIYYSALNQTRLIACLSKVQELSLFCITTTGSISSELGQALVSARLNHLKLGLGIGLTDDVQLMLLDSIREGHGPNGLIVHADNFGSRENLVRFCKALPPPQNGQKCLKSVGIDNANGTLRELDPEVETALLAVLSKNSELTSFTLTNFDITQAFWTTLLDSIALHPSLRKLNFSAMKISDCTMTRAERTVQVAQVILENEHIEEMEFCCRLLDEKVWKQRLLPALQHNEHRKRFETISLSHSRKAILAEVLQNLNNRPSLVYTLLVQNLDVIVDSVPDSPLALHPNTNKRCISSDVIPALEQNRESAIPNDEECAGSQLTSTSLARKKPKVS